MRPPRARRAGFTLIEILVVVIIIGLLAGVSMNNYHNAQDRARVGALQSNVRTLATALELYASDNGGSYPHAGNELTSDEGGLLRNSYLNNANTWPRSPWGGQIQNNHLDPVAPPVMQPGSALAAGTPLPVFVSNPPVVIPPGKGVVATSQEFKPETYGAICYDFDAPTTTWVMYGTGKVGSKPILAASRTNGGGN